MYVIIRLEVRGPDIPTLGKLEKLEKTSQYDWQYLDHSNYSQLARLKNCTHMTSSAGI